MTAFMLHIIKRNVIAAVVILLVGIVAAVTKGKYTSRWKYDMWLIISLFLLFPVNIFRDESHSAAGGSAADGVLDRWPEHCGIRWGLVRQ